MENNHGNKTVAFLAWFMETFWNIAGCTVLLTMRTHGR